MIRIASIPPSAPAPGVRAVELGDQQAASLVVRRLDPHRRLELARRPGDVTGADAVPAIEEVRVVGRRVDAQSILEGLLRLGNATLHRQQAGARDDRLGEPRLELERARLAAMASSKSAGVMSSRHWPLIASALASPAWAWANPASCAIARRNMPTASSTVPSPCWRSRCWPRRYWS